MKSTAIRFLLMFLCVSSMAFPADIQNQEIGEDQIPKLSVISALVLPAKEVEALTEVALIGYIADLGDKGLYIFASKEHADLGEPIYGISIRLDKGKAPVGLKIPVRQWVRVIGRMGIINEFEGNRDHFRRQIFIKDAQGLNP